jgi:hypothetical protein
MRIGGIGMEGNVIVMTVIDLLRFEMGKNRGIMATMPACVVSCVRKLIYGNKVI